MTVDSKKSLQTLVSFGYKPKLVLDIGCNAGSWTNEMQKQFPDASFVMIDAVVRPRNNDKPFIHAILSDTEREIDWYNIDGGNGTGNSYFKETTSHYKNTIPTKKTCTTLNVLFEQGKIHNQFDFIKMDVQGAELAIMAGASLFLDAAEVILLEMSFASECNKGSPRFPEYIAYMDSLGFLCYDIFEMHRHRGILTHLDILFVKKSSKIWDRVATAISNFGVD